MKHVKMRHRDLDTEIEVPESAVPFHRSAGWEVVPDPPPEDEKTPAAPAESGASSSKAPKGRRGSSKESE